MSRNRKSTIDGLYADLTSLLSEYSEEVKQKVIEAVVDVAESKTKDLKTAGKFKGKTYRKSWTNQTEKAKGSISATVYNDKHYRLTHLLENGHAVKGGKGRTQTLKTSTKFVHIAPVNEKAQQELESKIKEAIENG